MNSYLRLIDKEIDKLSKWVEEFRCVRYVYGTRLFCKKPPYSYTHVVTRLNQLKYHAIMLHLHFNAGVNHLSILLLNAQYYFHLDMLRMKWNKSHRMPNKPNNPNKSSEHQRHWFVQSCTVLSVLDEYVQKWLRSCTFAVGNDWKVLDQLCVILVRWWTNILRQHPPNSSYFHKILNAVKPKVLAIVERVWVKEVLGKHDTDLCGRICKLATRCRDLTLFETWKRRLEYKMNTGRRHPPTNRYCVFIERPHFWRWSASDWYLLWTSENKLWCRFRRHLLQYAMYFMDLCAANVNVTPSSAVVLLGSVVEAITKCLKDAFNLLTESSKIHCGSVEFPVAFVWFVASQFLAQCIELRLRMVTPPYRDKLMEVWSFDIVLNERMQQWENWRLKRRVEPPLQLFQWSPYHCKLIECFCTVSLCLID